MSYKRTGNPSGRPKGKKNSANIFSLYAVLVKLHKNDSLFHATPNKLILLRSRSEIVIPADISVRVKYTYQYLKQIYNKEVDRLVSNGITDYKKITE